MTDRREIAQSRRVAPIAPGGAMGTRRVAAKEGGVPGTRCSSNCNGWTAEAFMNNAGWIPHGFLWPE